MPEVENVTLLFQYIGKLVKQFAVMFVTENGEVEPPDRANPER